MSFRNSQLLWTTLLSVLSGLHTSCEGCSCSVFYDPLYLQAGVTYINFDTCLECLQCSSGYNPLRITQVEWENTQSQQHGVASDNGEQSYHINLENALENSGLYNFLITYTFLCPNLLITETTQKTLNVYVYGANVTHYREKEDSSVYFECRTGLQGVAKENVKLNLTFTRNDSRKCSAICGEEQQLECNGGKLSWSEDVGLCRLTIARPVTADSGELCCTASNSRNSEVKDCDTLSVLEGVKILPATTQSTHSHELSELAKIIVGSTCGGVLLIIVVVVAVIVALIIVWAWWRRRRPEPAPLVRYQNLGEGEGEKGP